MFDSFGLAMIGFGASESFESPYILVKLVWWRFALCSLFVVEGRELWKALRGVGGRERSLGRSDAGV